MILTDYYKFEKLPNQKSKLRIDCTASTKSYPDFEELRNKSGILCLYIGDNTHTQAGIKRKSDLALTKSKHITSIYTPDIESDYSHGDMRRTSDAILFIFSNVEFVEGNINVGATIEALIARGQRNNRNSLFNELTDGVYDDEIAELRKRAVTEIVTDKKE
jgi:hypothetical protein